MQISEAERRQRLQRAQQIRGTLRASGVTLAGWARAHGFQREIVAQVLAGKLWGHHGESHRVAVALGLKEGPVADPRDVTFSAEKKQ